MGALELNGFDELEAELRRLDMYDDVAPKLLDGSIDILETNLKKETAKHIGSGNMHNSISSQKAKKNKYGWYAVARPRGVDENGVRNMDKLAYLEYGTSKQPATPVIAPAVNNSTTATEERMQQLFDEMVGGG